MKHNPYFTTRKKRTGEQKTSFGVTDPSLTPKRKPQHEQSPVPIKITTLNARCDNSLESNKIETSGFEVIRLSSKPFVNPKNEATTAQNFLLSRDSNSTRFAT
jgi:hypothetical protein